MVKPKAKMASTTNPRHPAQAAASNNSFPISTRAPEDAAAAAAPPAGQAGSAVFHPSNGHLPLGLSNSPDATVAATALLNLAELDVAEKIKDLVRLSQEQGYLTYADINDGFAGQLRSAEALDEICARLHSLEVEIVNQAVVDL